MDKGMIFVPLGGRSAAFVAYWTLRLFFFIKSHALQNQPAWLSTKKYQFWCAVAAGVDSSCDSNTPVWRSVLS